MCSTSQTVVTQSMYCQRSVGGPGTRCDQRQDVLEVVAIERVITASVVMRCPFLSEERRGADMSDRDAAGQCGVDCGLDRDRIPRIAAPAEVFPNGHQIEGDSAGSDPAVRVPPVLEISAESTSGQIILKTLGFGIGAGRQHAVDV